MSMSISVTDILKCIELCKWMLDRCFKRVKSAHIKYLQFGKDIESLLDTLDKIYVPFQKATDLQNRYKDISHPSESSRQQLEKESGELMGGLRETIWKCDNILTKHVNYQYSDTGRITNIIWDLRTEKQVEKLRSDIQFHNIKIQLLLKPIELTLLTDIAIGVEDIAIGVEDILTILKGRFGLAENQEIDPIPDWLADRFQKALETNSPEGFTTVEQFPLKEGFDCLYYHLWSGTVSSSYNEASGHTIEQYLSLLKARWILDVLKQAAPFRNARRGSLYRPSVLRLEKQILLEYGRIDPHEFRDTDLMRLDESAFLIWREDPSAEPPSIAEPELSEQEVLRLQLLRDPSAPRQELIVFRRGPTVLRLACNIFPPNSNIPSQKSERIDTHSVALIPWYVIQSQPLIESPLRLEMSYGRSSGNALYDFQTDKDLFSFQRVVTGYKTVADLRDVKWTLHKKRLFRRSESLEGVARVQIWSCNPHDEISVQASETDNPPYIRSTRSSNLDQASSGSSRSHATLDALVDGVGGSTVLSVDSVGDDALLALRNVPLPVIMIYTKFKGRHTMLHFQVSNYLEVDESKCDCRRESATCKDAVLRNLRSAIIVRLVSAADDELDSWNLSIFGNPIHPYFNDDDRVKKLECRTLHLSFPKVEDKDHFKLHLQIAKVLHRNTQRGSGEVERWVRQSGRVPRPPSSSQYSFHSTLSRTASLAQQSTPLLEDNVEWLNTNTPTAALAPSQQQATSGDNGRINDMRAELTLRGNTDGLCSDGYHGQRSQPENIPPIQEYGSPRLTHSGIIHSASPSTADSRRRHTQPPLRNSTITESSGNSDPWRDRRPSLDENGFPGPKRSSTSPDPRDHYHAPQSATNTSRSRPLNYTQYPLNTAQDLRTLSGGPSWASEEPMENICAGHQSETPYSDINKPCSHLPNELSTFPAPNHFAHEHDMDFTNHGPNANAVNPYQSATGGRQPCRTSQVSVSSDISTLRDVPQVAPGRPGAADPSTGKIDAISPSTTFPMSGSPTSGAVTRTPRQLNTSASSPMGGVSMGPFHQSQPFGFPHAYGTLQSDNPHPSSRPPPVSVASTLTMNTRRPSNGSSFWTPSTNNQRTSSQLSPGTTPPTSPDLSPLEPEFSGRHDREGTR